ncbi:helix-turn-helix domain-containing protein [Winogradskyella bathintestinalis]|uniref:AraC family transcriptional regulator n=1 Tax=Winogradskyella bathintestinalis TaxID=3035208 RepID=A0ABT7ZUY5_9FLAO|nr:AraC family transcriptional regulator [Winogradskyella bathintestinalis]MDN3492822.1 AraC family transcriptional regulator [Winogradskyella bathintestinalis]
MKTIEIKANNLQSMFHNLRNIIGGTFTTQLNEGELQIDNEIGKGFIRGIELERDTTFVEFDIKFKDNVKFILESPKRSVVNFLYCAEGKLSHSFNNNTGKTTSIGTFQTGISTNIVTTENHIYFEKDVYVNASIVTVNTSTSTLEEHHINKMVSEIFIENNETDYCYTGSYNLKIADSINQLKAIKQKGVVRTLLIQGLVNVILAMEIEQHSMDLESSQNPTGSLTTYELKQVKELSDYINNFPETNLSVMELAAKISISPAKVQVGFKLMHGKTLNTYIRYVRIKKSEELIKNTDLNISEIVYSLGFSSRSYFSKIFKDQYNCSPIEYKQNIKFAATA